MRNGNRTYNCVLWLAPVGREVVEAVEEYAYDYGVRLGLIASRSQVNMDVGYSGYTQQTLHMAAAHCTIERDHLGKTEDAIVACQTIRDDEEAAWDGVFVDSDDGAVMKAACDSSMWIEAGCGESQTADFMARLATYPKGRFRWASFPTGCLIQGLGNIGRVNGPLISDMSRAWPGVLLRGHNADYLDAETTVKLAGLVDGLNVAPQLGTLVTAYYIMTATHHGYDLTSWKRRVFDGGRWRTWTAVREDGEYDWHDAVIAGGHYHWEQLPDSFRADHIDGAKRVVKSWIERTLKLIAEGRDQGGRPAWAPLP
jgi:hypothetical protein